MRNDVLLHYGVKGMKWRRKKGKLAESTNKQAEQSVNLVDRRMQQVKRDMIARKAQQRKFMDESRKVVDDAKKAMGRTKRKQQIDNAIKTNQIKREWDKINDKVNPGRAKRKPKVHLK